MATYGKTHFPRNADTIIVVEGGGGRGQYIVATVP